MTSQTVKFARVRLERFEADRVYSYTAQRDLWGYGFRVTRRSGAYQKAK
jgi:hypothetical protein